MGQLDIEGDGRAARGVREKESGRMEWEGSGGWRACAVENYTTGINHRCTTVSLSSPNFSLSRLYHIFFLTAARLPSLICTPTAPPQLPPFPTTAPTSLKPSALYSSPTPLAMGFIGGSGGQPLRFSIHLNFISTVVCLHGFFIDPLFVACCMGRIYPSCPWNCISEP